MTAPPATPAVPNLSYRVWLNGKDGGPETFHEVRVRHVDRVAAERASLPLLMGQNMTDLPTTMITAWLWAAMRRQGLYDGTLKQFVDVDCLETEPVEDDEDGDTGVPPTLPGPGSASV